MTKTIGALIGLGLFSTVALAQSKQDPLEACYQQPDGAPRLACFNREMQRRQAATAATGKATAPAAGAVGTLPAPAPTAPPAVSDRKVAADTVGLQGSALRKKLKAEGVSPEQVQPIVAKVVRMVPRPHAELAFVLDNGQTWEQIETLDSLNIRLQDTVTIKPGILGAFFLSTPRSQTIRVHRIL
jgi:hypothetical protein